MMMIMMMIKARGYNTLDAYFLRARSRGAGEGAMGTDLWSGKYDWDKEANINLSLP